MRQIFSLPRIENVKLLEGLLEDAGIDTRITGLSKWKRPKSREFSYSNPDGRQTWPVLWVVKAQDYPRARQLLRDEGVHIDSTRSTGARSSYLESNPRAVAEAARVKRGGWIITRVRVVLIVTLVAVSLATFLKHLGMV